MKKRALCPLSGVHLTIKPKFMLIKDREDLNIFYPESHETWDDYKINLLYNCADTTVLYSIANDLLLKKNVLGLLGIWNNCRVSKLPAYRQFVKWCCEKRQKEIIVMLVIINHNNGNRKFNIELQSQVLV